MNKVYFEFDPRALSYDQAIQRAVIIGNGWDNIKELKVLKVVDNAELWCCIVKLHNDV